MVSNRHLISPLKPIHLVAVGAFIVVVLGCMIWTTLGPYGPLPLFWSKTTGTVLAANVQRHVYVSAPNEYTLELSYSYKVGKQTFFGSGTNKHYSDWDEDQAEADAKRFRDAHASVTVYYNSAHPADSVTCLVQIPPLLSYAALGGMVLLIAFIHHGASRRRRKFRSNSSTRGD